MKMYKIKQVLLRWSVVLAAVLIVLIILFIRARPVILSYARTRAQAIMISAFDDAVISALEELNYSYDDMAVIVRNADNAVCSIEIDHNKLNILRSEISRKVYSAMAEKSCNDIYIPLGTLLSSEYFAGYGPGIKFKFQFAQIPRLTFESKFYSAGINNIFHQINIKADLSYSIVMRGVDETFTVGLTAVAAQTVIAGVVPGSFTNVTESQGSNVADDIFNYRSN